MITHGHEPNLSCGFCKATGENLMGWKPILRIIFQPVRQRESQYSPVLETPLMCCCLSA